MTDPCPCRVVAPFRFQPTRAGLRGLGATTGSVATTAAQGASAGSVAGPIGAVVGGVIGAVVGLFGGKSNPQIAIDKTQAINLFGQYSNVAGTVSGRSIGSATMNFVMRGAMFSGHFPKCQSTGWIDMLTMQQGKGGGCDNCFGVLWQAARTGAQAPGGSGKNTGNGGVPVRDAKTFVDRYVWPSNSPDVDTIPWVTATDAIGMQIVYDAADAYLGQQDPTTLPLVGQTVQTQANVVLPTVTPVAAPTTAPTVNPVGSTAPAAATPVTIVNQPAPIATPTPAAPTVNPVGSPAPTTTTATPTVTPTQLVSQPPVLGSSLVYAPDRSQNGAPLQLPAGFVYAGMDPYNQSWILRNVNDGQLYVLWQGNVIPYTSNMFAPASSATAGPSAVSIAPTGSSQPSPTVGTTSSGVPVTQADIQALIAQLQAQGQTGQQAYTSALTTLGSQGISATPAVQTAVQSAVAATPTTAGVSGTGWLGLAAIGATLMFATAHPAPRPGRRRRSGR